MSFMNKETDQSNVPFQNPDQVTIDDLVGEGKKYKDTEALAKAIAHSQNQIHSLTNGMDELRADLQTRITVEDALNKLSQPAEATPKVDAPVEPKEPTPSENVQGMTPEEIQKTIEDTLKAREANTSKQANLAKAQEVVGALHGSDAEVFIEKKAQELGLSVDQLKAQAEISPSAFFKLLDIKPDGPAPTSKTPTYTRPNVQRKADPNALETREDFLALRKENPTKFWSPKVQQKFLKMEMENISKA